MTSSTRPSQAEQSPLGNRKHLSRLLLQFVLKEEEGVGDDSKNWKPFSSPTPLQVDTPPIRPRVHFTPGQHPEVYPALTKPGLCSSKPDTHPRAVSWTYWGTAAPAFLSPTGKHHRCSLRRQPLLQSMAARRTGTSGDPSQRRWPGGVAEPRRTTLLTGRRRARTAPGTRAPAGRRRCGQKKEKRGSFNTRGLTGTAPAAAPLACRQPGPNGPNGRGGKGEGGGASVTSGSSSAPSPAAPARRGCGPRRGRAAPWWRQ